MSEFNVTKISSKYKVNWPVNLQIDSIIGCKKLFDLIFKNTKNYKIGLAVKSYDDFEDILYIEYNDYAQNLFFEYSEYLFKMYVISGIIFEIENEAKNFSEELHKKVMWKLLKD